jgi:hypothetical protein
LLLRTRGPWCLSQREGIGVLCPDIIAVPKYPARRRRKNYLSVKIQTRQTLLAVTPNQMLHTSSRSPRMSVPCEIFASGQRTHATRTHARTRPTHARTRPTQRTHATRTHATHAAHACDARTRGRVSTCKLRFRLGWKAKRTPWRWPRSFGLDDTGAPYHGRQMRIWSELGRQERVHVGRQVHFEEQETPGRIQSSCPCPNFFTGKRQAMHRCSCLWPAGIMLVLAKLALGGGQVPWISVAF